MNTKNALRNYLIKYFFLILILVGAVESCLNLAYHTLIFPWIQQIFDFDQHISDLSLSGTVVLLLESFFGLFLGNIAKLFPGALGTLLQNIAGNLTEKWLRNQFFVNSGSSPLLNERLYLTGLFCAFILLAIAWLLPYLLGSLVFGILVSKKAAALEAEKIEQQRSYEKQRNLLLSDVAHDLKTPMTTVAGYASALSEGTVTDSEKQQEYLNAIYRKSMQMNELIQLLFEYVKLDSAGFSLKKETLNLAELLRECVVQLYAEFEEKDMELYIDIPEENIPASIDRLQFERAIRNLLVNAQKHNPVGTKVGISLKLQGDKLLIEISDNGIVIPAETAAHLFEPFVQGDASRSGKGGSGLGLSITEKVISMHNGTIELKQSVSGQNLKNGYTKTFLITLKDALSVY